MKNISALFLVLLLAPFTIAQTNFIETIQKTDEGRELMDTLFLEAAVAGDDLNANVVRYRVQLVKDQTKKVRAALKAAAVESKKLCKSTLAQLRERYHDFNNRRANVQGTLTFAENAVKRKEVIAARVEEELGHYRRFSALNKQNHNNWKNFYESARKAYLTASNLIARLRTQVHALHRRNRERVFIELPDTYTQALSQITSEFNDTTYNLDGFRPIIANLLEVLARPTGLVEPKARKSVRKVLKRLAEIFHDKANEFAEENEHQNGLFDGLDNLFNSSLSRSQRHSTEVSRSLEKQKKKVSWFRTAAKAAGQLADLAKGVVDVKTGECRHIQEEISRARRRGSKVLTASYQVLEVLEDRFGVLKRALLERMSDQ